MPSSLIEVRREYTDAQEVALMDAVHNALVAAFKIPVEDRNVRVLTYRPHQMVHGTEPGVADSYTRVTIDCFSGRSLDAKRALYREVTHRLGALGVPPHNVSILLRESPIENWAWDGQAACDHDLGFTVEV